MSTAGTLMALSIAAVALWCSVVWRVRHRIGPGPVQQGVRGAFFITFYAVLGTTTAVSLSTVLAPGGDASTVLATMTRAAFVVGGGVALLATFREH